MKGFGLLTRCWLGKEPCGRRQSGSGRMEGQELMVHFCASKSNIIPSVQLRGTAGVGRRKGLSTDWSYWEINFCAIHRPLGILFPNPASLYKGFSHHWRSSKTLTCFWTLLGRQADKQLCWIKRAPQDQGVCLGTREATLTSSKLDLWDRELSSGLELALKQLWKHASFPFCPKL